MLIGLSIAKYATINITCLSESIRKLTGNMLSFFLSALIFCELVSLIITDERKTLINTIIKITFAIGLVLWYADTVCKLCLLEIAGKNIIVEQNVGVKHLLKLFLIEFSIYKVTLVSLCVAFWIKFLESSIVSRIRNSHYHKMESQEKTSAMKGLLSFGIFASNNQLSFMKYEIITLKNYANKIFIKLFIPIIPFYISSFIIKAVLNT
ncbi:MAG: hypothetical protein LBD36_02805 [Holosporales bacterium]|jgi:hypothetical protein|nr:hypothetical protein [Holosporales bacterium]